MKTGFFTLTPEDRPQLVAHFLRLSDADRRLRFNCSMSSELLQRWCDALDITMATGFFSFGKLVAVALVCPEEEGCYEFAISVDKEYRGDGLAHLLLEQAMEHSAIAKLVIRHASENTAMARVHRGYQSTRHLEMGEVDVTIDAKQFRKEHQRALELLVAHDAD